MECMIIKNLKEINNEKLSLYSIKDLINDLNVKNIILLNEKSYRIEQFIKLKKLNKILTIF